MEGAVQKSICDLQHEQIEKDINIINMRQEKTDDKVNKLENISAQRTAEVENICEAVSVLSIKIDKILEQNNSMMRTILIVFAGFFMFVIQQMVTGHLRF